MKLLTFLLFLAVSVLSQAAEKITFRNVVTIAYKKLRDHEYMLRRLRIYGELDCLDKIGDTAYLLNQILVNTDEFTSSANAEHLISKVPNSVEMNDTINAINKARTVDFLQLYREISAELSVNSPEENDHTFIEGYKIFAKTSRSEQEARRIIAKINPIRRSYEIISNRYLAELKKFGKIGHNLKDDVESIRLDCESMALSGDGVKEAIDALDTLNRKHQEMIELLEKIRDILKEYNKQRPLWADFLIGLTEEIGGERTPIVPTSTNSMAKKLGNLILGGKGKETK